MGIQQLSSINELRLRHDAELQKISQDNGFSKVLGEEIQKTEGALKFSKHAISRMNERGVDFNETLEKDLNNAIEKARQKGARDVVVIAPDNVFVVNVPNNMVVTTMNAHEMKEKIFTNIDSAVIL